MSTETEPSEDREGSDLTADPYEVAANRGQRPPTVFFED